MYRLDGAEGSAIVEHVTLSEGIGEGMGAGMAALLDMELITVREGEYRIREV